ncbi:MAG: ABC transporter ATP-binding protein [Acidimicrobiales bacterium]
MLDVDGVTKSFGGVRALVDVSFRAERGQVTGLIGPNGAGKSTLLSCLSGWLRPDSGSVRFDGVELVGASPQELARAGVIRSFQNLQLFDALTVEENLAIGSWRLGRTGLPGALVGSRRSRNERELVATAVEEVAGRLGITAVLGTQAGALPYGTRKKVELARALMAEPELLLLDEPAAGLDDHERDELGAVVAEVASSVAVVLVEHAIELVLSLSANVVVLDFGAVIASGAPAAVRDHPRVVEAYLGAQT